ncbi:DUF943 family protein [Erwinia sp. PsM31]|nr:DUF943 family protein [Erwinia sp. PsM31]
MRMFIIAALTIVSGLFYCLFIRGEAVCVMDAHYDGSTAQVIVNKLPFTDSEKIEWWLRNEVKVRDKYHIPSGNAGPFLITVYAFGEGYKEEGKEDRLCFRDVKSPQNCIDKKVLMMIWRTREGGVKYEF